MIICLQKIIAVLWLAVYLPLIVTIDLFHNHEAVVHCCGDHSALNGLEFHSADCAAAHDHCPVDALLAAHGPLNSLNFDVDIFIAHSRHVIYFCPNFPSFFFPQERAPPSISLKSFSNQFYKI